MKLKSKKNIQTFRGLPFFRCFIHRRTTLAYSAFCSAY